MNFGTPPNLYSAKFGCFDMNGNIGIVGTPVIQLGGDGHTGTLYVVALTKVGDGFAQRLHALDIATGADLPTSPVVISTKDFDPLMQNQRPALLLANDTVYIGYASHCDKEPYHGFLLGYNAKTLQQTAVFNTTPTGMGASIWQSGQAPAADAAGQHLRRQRQRQLGWRDELQRELPETRPSSLKLLDWFTPTDHFDLDAKDTDVNSSGATLIPGTQLVVGGGKSGVLYTLNTSKFRPPRRRTRRPVLPGDRLPLAQHCLLEQRQERQAAVHLGTTG